eukprot:11572881-Ditylum_brightwellii.AAC.1
MFSSNAQHFNLINHEHLLDEILITGEVGSGKTHMSLLVLATMRIRYRVATLYLDCKRLQSSTTSRLKDILNEMTTFFRAASLCQPCVLVLDNLDSLLPNVDASGEDDDGSIQHIKQVNPLVVNQVKVIADHFKVLKDELINAHEKPISCKTEDNSSTSSTAKGVVLVCTSQSCNSLFYTTRLTGAFSLVVDVPNIDSKERVRLFADICIHHKNHEDVQMLIKGVMHDFGKKTE